MQKRCEVMSVYHSRSCAAELLIESPHFLDADSGLGFKNGDANTLALKGRLESSTARECHDKGLIPVPLKTSCKAGCVALRTSRRK
jgi:hypothetical protein